MYDDMKKVVPRRDAGDMDLFELCSNLWEEKWLIVAATVLGLLLALVYLFVATPVYKTEATVIPPRQSDIAGFNLGRLSISVAQRSPQGDSSSVTPLPEYTVDHVYSVFKRNLFSTALRNRFFEQHYLPFLNVDIEQQPAARDQLLKGFSETLFIRQPNQRERPDYYEVTVELGDPDTAAHWANEYVKFAAELATNEMIENVISEIGTRSRVAETRINSLRAFARQQRQDRIARLKEALSIASALGIESPQVTVGRASADSELAAFVEGDLMYMRGTKALQAELNMLENRQNDDPFIRELRSLENQLEILKGITIDETNVGVFTLDGVAEVPETPIKPNRLFVLVTAVLLGGILGIAVAFVRISISGRASNRKLA